MELLCIGIKSEIEKINDILNEKINIFEKEDLYIDRKIKKVGDITYLSYILENSNESRYNNINNIFKHYMASGISDIVLELYQDKIIERLLEEKWSYFEPYEKEKIKINVFQYLNKNDYITTEGIMYKISKKAKVLKSILEYLDYNNEINIDGFVNFRLKFFVDMIEDAIDRSVEDYIVEREYKEFIKILQYFVDIQTPKVDSVNILIKKDKYTLYDKNKELIRNEFMEEFAEEMFDNDMNYDDLLISSLITIAPKKIVIHVDENNRENQVIEIIENIFPNKTTFCCDCDLCKKSSTLKSRNKVNKEK